VRASVAGWLVAASVLGAVAGLLAFGAVADLGHRFGVAALAVFLPALLGLALFLRLPETGDANPKTCGPRCPEPPPARPGPQKIMRRTSQRSRSRSKIPPPGPGEPDPAEADAPAGDRR
jgi:hypothetical protein